MNFKIIFFSAAVLIATVVNGQPELPECTIGVDTEACTTPFGHDGYFIHKVVNDETTTSSLRPGIAGGRFGGGRGGGVGGRRGGRGGPRLSSSRCVPIDAPEPADGMGMGMGMGPFGGDFDGLDNVNRPIPQLECGCEDEVCPTAISCPCDCEITLPFGATMQGTKATITKRDGSTVNKCVPPAYADADRFTCITDCSVEIDTPFL